MKDEMRAALAGVVERLVRLAAEEPSFRSQLLLLLDALQAAVRNTQKEAEEQQVPDACVLHEPFPPEPPLSMPAAAGRDEPAGLTLDGSAASEVPPAPGQATPPPLAAAPPSWPARSPTTEADLEDIEARCRLKAEASRWAATRRRLLAAGASFRTEIGPRDQEMLDRGREGECYLWMCSPNSPAVPDPGQYDVLAGCFEAVAEALALVRLLLEPPAAPKSLLASSLHLLAEAQSALRVAVAEVGEYADADQGQVFEWLRTTTDEEQVYISRHMKLEDPADPANAAGLGERIQAARSEVERARKTASRHKKLLGKIRHKLSLLGTATETDVDELWQALATTVDELVSGGLPPSDKQLREYLLPVIDRMPEFPEVPTGFRLFLRELDRYRQGVRPPAAREPGEEPSAQVQAVSRLLAGRSLVLIGGDPRPGPKEALERAFGLRELIWVATREHESFRVFEPAVARPDTAVVLLAIRWSSHSHAEVQAYCERYGKALVRLPGGYNPNQVAAQILMQCGDRLSAAGGSE